jgi:hypothetical protein
MTKPLALLTLALLTAATPAAVTPSGLNRSRYTTSVTITATGTAATLDGAPFPLNTATAVTAIGYHELTVTDGATTTYAFIVRNSERGSTEDGIPTMRPYRLIMDAPSAFADANLHILAPSAHPKNLPVPVMARLTKGAAFGAAAGDPLFLYGRVRTANFPASPILMRRGWGSTIIPASATAGTTSYDAQLNGLTATAPIVFEETTSWTTKTGTLGGSEDWGSNARIHVTGALSVPAGATLTIGAGTIVRCAPGVEFRVKAGGTFNINGTTAAPVVFVPDNTSNLWGGIWLQPQSGASVARLTATGAIFCCWGADQNWFANVPAGEPAKNFPHHRNQQPCVATATGAVCTLSDCAMIGPIGLSQTRGAALATNGGSLIFDRVLAQRCITGGEQEDCPVFELNACAFMEMNEPGVDVDSDAFSDADNDGLYLVPRGRTFNLRKTVIGWTKDDGIDTGGDGSGNTLCYDCWFENCIHEGISNSGVNRVPQSHRGVHFNNGQGMECGYGGPHSLVKDCAIIGNMVGARYGDNYGNNSGSNGSGTSQYDGDITSDGSLLLYNYFHDSWAIDFSRWTYQNQRFTMLNTKVSKAGDLAAQNGAEDSGNSLWNPATDGALLAPRMPVPGSNVGLDFTAAKRQDTTAAWPAQFTARLSTFSSNQVTAGWRVTGKASPEAVTETVIATGSLTYLAGETLKTFSVSLPAPNPHGVLIVSLETPANAEVTGLPLLFFPAAGPPPGDLVLVAKNSAGWSYHAEVLSGAVLPALDPNSRDWTHPLFSNPAPWYVNRTAPLGWGNIGAATPYLVLGTTITERPVTVYARKTFTVADPGAVQSLLLECMGDDGAHAYINGTRISPTSWGLDPGTTVGGAIYYNKLSTRFRGNDAAEDDYDTQTVSGASLPVLHPAPALNVLAVEVHQNSVDSSDCALDAALTASFSAPSTGTWGIGSSAAGSYLYWTDPAWVPQTSNNLGQWTNRPDLTSPVPLLDLPARQFYRLIMP